MRDGRLSSFGRAVVRECERLGVIVDVTHIPVKAFYDVVEIARHPIIVSHGAASSVTTDLDDDRLHALVSTCGLIGIHFYTTYLGSNPTVEDVFRQVDYIAETFGIDYVALGIDFFPTEGPWKDLKIAQGTTNLEWAIKDMSEMPKITACLLDHGYSEDDIRKVLGLNFLRVCRDVLLPR